ncbi:MAG: glycosyltransferase family 4 protein, partial [Sphingobium sp.]
PLRHCRQCTGEVERARASARSMGIGNVVDLPGWIDGERKQDLLRTSGIYILPSHNEGLPVSLLEAMSHGLAVIGSRVGGIPELIRDGTDGLLVDAGDVAAIADALERLLSDDALRERLGSAARARIDDAFSDRAVLPLLDQLYRHCTAPPEAASAAPQQL